MSRRDYRHREPKKPKKSDLKPEPVSILPTSATEVEVVRKKKKERKETEEE